MNLVLLTIITQNTVHFFVVAMVRVLDKQQALKAYKRFVSSNIEELKKLDKDRVLKNGKIKEGGKMFLDGKFKEIKGSQLDAFTKKKFISFLAKKKSIEVIFIKLDNSKLDDVFCSNTARAFNYPLKLAIAYYIKHGVLPNEECILQLDERNERTETKHFLAEYLNTELVLGEECKGPFVVQYYDSSTNRLIQIADVFANWYYSHLFTDGYKEEMELLKKEDILKGIFNFPPTRH